MVLHGNTWLLWDLVLLYVSLTMEKAGYWKGGDIESQTGWKNHSVILRKSGIHFPLRTWFLFSLHWMWWFAVWLVWLSNTKASTWHGFTVRVVYCVMKSSEAKTSYGHCALVVNESFRLWSPGKGILFSSEQGSIVTGKAWGFSVLLL